MNTEAYTVPYYFDASGISWTGKTTNPVIGCKEVNEDCRECYAKKMAWRLSHNPKVKHLYEGLTEKRNGKIYWTGKVAFNPKAMQKVVAKKKPTLWFADSMSDLFYEQIPLTVLIEVFQTMKENPRHAFQILTKRPRMMRELIPKIWDIVNDGKPLENVWLGASAGGQVRYEEMLDDLLETPAHIRFLSLEPLTSEIEELFLDIPSVNKRIDWVIVGGESGSRARPCKLSWIESIVNQCKLNSVPVFDKQLGSVLAKELSATHSITCSKGSKFNELPDSVRIRQMPIKIRQKAL